MTNTTAHNAKMFKFPKGQILWESSWDKNNCLKYFITSNADRSKYYKYGLDADGNTVRLATGSSPRDLK